MKLKRLVLVVLALLVLLVVVPFLIPMGTYVRQIEQASSEKLGVPVTVKSLHVALLPSPRANVSGVVIGKDAEIQVSNVAAVLDVSTLFDAVRVVSRLEVDQPMVKKGALDMLSSLAASKSGEGAAPIAIRRIVVHQAKLLWPDMNLPAINADIAMSDAGKLQLAAITSSDGKLSIKATPKGEGYAAQLKAQQWTSPVGPPVVFNTLSADLEYAGSVLDVPNIRASLYRGKLDASVKLDWKKDWRLSGQLKTDAIELGDASKLFTRTTKVSGRISGNGTFSSSAKEAGQLADKLVLDYKFNVANGVLYGMDLVKAASLLVRQGQTGGETHFDELSGTLHTSGKLVELRQVQATSGLLNAQGNVKITPDRKLAGKVDAELKKGVALVTVPLEISGNMDHPVILPTKAALAGAVAGTAVLGPLGTGLGVKAGSALDKMFGKGE